MAGIAAIGAFALPATASASDCSRTSVGLTPLNDLGSGTYQGYQGGLYDGSNARPAAHETTGQLLADSVVPLDGSGSPSASGRYVLLSIGMSNTTEEFSTFKPLADADSAKDPHLVIVDGAQGGVDGTRWANPSDPAWSTLDSRLAGAGVTPQQVSVVWVKLADAGPTSGFPAAAQTLQSHIETVLGLLRQRFPNLRLAYLTSRIYAGYATTTLNPEPYAYESGFSVKWTIADQLAGAKSLNYDPARGPVRAPWLSWGPYLWADGLAARSDGLTWACSDFSSDGTHPSAAGQSKVATMLLDFFKSDSTARLWFSPPRASSRTVSLHLGKHQRHIVARGATTTNGFVGCVIDVSVDLQRRARHHWRTLKAPATDASGAYRARLPDEPGAYRARVARSLTGAQADEPCAAATSPHRHRR